MTTIVTVLLSLLLNTVDPQASGSGEIQGTQPGTEQHDIIIVDEEMD